MIETSNINYHFREWPYGKFRNDNFFMDLVIWLIGLPIVGLVLIMPVAILFRLLEVNNNVMINRAIAIVSISVAMVFGLKKILKNRSDKHRSWLKEKELYEKEFAKSYAEKNTITNIIQYWTIEEDEPIYGYLIRTQENEWFYIISEQLGEFELDSFPKSQVTIIRAPFSKNILEIDTKGREAKYMDTVQLYKFIDDYSYVNLGFDVLAPALCQTLQTSLVEDEKQES
ncbi:hypothetical protein [Gimesia aquarii]|uniref:Uncharacterized protein n=1 Tax=Gimesia aquarii TaxID=2527964 RepID=A0A517X1Q4_9PLAN|nr:hypothetical protein [Gimesia aquarii]QDU11430.1 hypothetical protein V202x_48520 [Gimesia aquarii]